MAKKIIDFEGHELQVDDADRLQIDANQVVDDRDLAVTLAGATGDQLLNKTLTEELIDEMAELPQIGPSDNNKYVRSYYVSPPLYGDEGDGNVTITPGPSSSDRFTYINDSTDMISDALLGALTINVTDASLFSAGDEVCLHQAQCYRDPSKRFQYEFLRVDSVDTGLNTITFTTGLSKAYDSDSTANTGEDTKTQVVRVPNYNTLTIQSGAGVCARPWNGRIGGLLLFRAKTLTGAGAISATDAGFRDSGVYSYFLEDRAGRGEGPLGYPKTYLTSAWEPTARDENFNAAKHTASGSATLANLGGSAFSDTNTSQIDGGVGTITPYLAKPYTKNGTDKIAASDMGDYLPMAKAKLLYKEDGSNLVFMGNSNPKDEAMNGGNASGGAIRVYVEAWGTFTGGLYSRCASGPQAGGYVSFMSETDFTGTVDVTGNTSGIVGDDGDDFTGQPTATIDKGYELETPPAFHTQNMLNVQDEKASGTNAPTGTGATWNTRELNTLVVDNIPGASVSSNQITLPAGEYYIDGDAPVHTGASGIYSKLRFRNVTDGATVAIGTQARVDGDAATNVRMTDEMFVSGAFTIATTKVFELQQWLSGTDTATLGIAAATGENEVYARLRIWKTD